MYVITGHCLFTDTNILYITSLKLVMLRNFTKVIRLINIVAMIFKQVLFFFTQNHMLIPFLKSISSFTEHEYNIRKNIKGLHKNWPDLFSFPSFQPQFLLVFTSFDYGQNYLEKTHVLKSLDVPTAYRKCSYKRDKKLGGRYVRFILLVSLVA